MDVSFQKLKLLKMSLDYRMEEYPVIAKALQGEEQNGECTPTTMPRPAQLSGTFYLKLLGVEGLLDLNTLRQSRLDLDSLTSPSRTYSAGQMAKVPAKNFMTLPNPNHREREREKEKAVVSTEEEAGGANTWYKRGSKHGRSKNTALQKQLSLDHIDEPNGECHQITCDWVSGFVRKRVSGHVQEAIDCLCHV